MSQLVKASASPRPGGAIRLFLAVTIPLAAFGLQWGFWSLIQPYVWFLFFPAVFFSSWIGGLRGGLAATVISTTIVWYFFIPPQLSFRVHSPMAWVSMSTVLGMGVLFSVVHERLRAAQGRAAGALAAVQLASDQLELQVQQRTAELQRTNAALRASEATYHAFFESASDGIILTDSAGQCRELNDAGCQMLGCSHDELLGQDLGRLLSEEERPRLGIELARTKAGEASCREWRFLRKSGNRLPVEASTTQLPDGRLLWILRDITEHRAKEEQIRELNHTLEQRVQERTEELQAANRELDAFAYAVSHDLRAPLRAMSGFSQALLEDHAANLPTAAQEDLQEIIVASRHMGELVEGLLRLSRSTRGELQRDPVDLSAMASRLLQDLASGAADRQVEWIVQPGLFARGDARMIEVVLANLLGNAWKYTARTAHPKIQVCSQGIGVEQSFCVIDNGAGFDVRHSVKLFQPFQRLHRQDEFPGLGIGLATVQRIIHRHGGTIQATAVPGQGATFRFTLPGSAGGEGKQL